MSRIKLAICEVSRRSRDLGLRLAVTMHDVKHTEATLHGTRLDVASLFKVRQSIQEHVIQGLPTASQPSPCPGGVLQVGLTVDT